MEKIMNRHSELVSESTKSRFRNKMRTTTKACKFAMAIAAILSVFMFFGCDQLQDSLSESKQEDVDEDTGYAYLDGKTWYYDGISTTDFSSTEGAALAVKFTRKAAMTGTRTVENNGSVTYSYNLSGSITANFTNTSGQTSTITTKISGNQITLGSSTLTAGALSADGKTFRLNMAPVCNLLDAQTAEGNSLSSVEVALSGFECAEGGQNGRSIPSFNKSFSVKPFYDDETITDGVAFSTVSSTTGKSITIPTNGSVSLADDAALTFSTEDSSVSLTSDDFTLGTTENGITISCSKDLKDLDFTGKFTVSGFVPELNASSYTRTFTVNFAPAAITLDGNLDEEAWATAAASTESLADPSGYNLTELLVTNDDNYLYVAVKGALSFNSGDRIILMIDNQSTTDAGKANTDEHDKDNYYCPATNATYSSVDFYLCHILSTPEMQDYTWISDSGRTDGVETSAASTSESVIEYKIPLSIIANAESGNILKIFAATTSYAWTTINETTLQDCIPSAAATVSNGGQTLSIDFANALDYTVKSSE